MPCLVLAAVTEQKFSPVISPTEGVKNGFPGLFVETGVSGHGFGLGTEAGLITGRSHLQPVDLRYWNFAFVVDDVDAAKDAVESAGGTVRIGPIELPTGQGWLILVTDPQGAKVMFAGPRPSTSAA